MTNCGHFFRSLLHGKRRPLPAGMDVKACLIFAMTDSNSEKGILRLVQRAVRSQPCNIVSRACRFASSHSVLSSPLKSKPRRHFSVEYWPSPFNSFFREMGLFSSTSSGGNTSCIPIIVARAVWQSCCFECGMITLMKSSTLISVMYHRGLSDSLGSVAVVKHVLVWCLNFCGGSVSTACRYIA